ncbi:MAG: hypothetical protein A2138_09990 [Deltaproteobacteria bacterium RBG_16_71_12]|nr:MAG: hypothetical protein A2138_09990 [Deltaproteobacteria bacterium RBG_16_71_12]
MAGAVGAIGALPRTPGGGPRTGVWGGIAKLPVSDAGDSVAAACGPTGRRGAQGLLADIFGRLGDVAAAGAAGAALGWATCSSAAGAA